MFPLTLGTNVSIVAYTPAIIPGVANLGAASVLGFAFILTHILVCAIISVEAIAWTLTWKAQQ